MNNSKFQDILKIVVITEGLNTVHSIFSYFLNSIDKWAEETNKEPLFDSSVEDTIQVSVIENPLTCPIDEYTENEYIKQLSNPYPRN